MTSMPGLTFEARCARTVSCMEALTASPDPNSATPHCRISVAGASATSAAPARAHASSSAGGRVGGGRLGEFGGAAEGDRLEFGGRADEERRHEVPPEVGVWVRRTWPDRPRYLTENTRPQSRHSQAPWPASCGQRLVSPQYAQYWA